VQLEHVLGVVQIDELVDLAVGSQMSARIARRVGDSFSRGSA
jgi:hypothetical protein